MIATDGIKHYYSLLEEETMRAYKLATSAREKGYDPAMKVEIALAADICDRVEGLVGPEGIAEAMRDYMKGHDREETALKVCDWIIEGKFGGNTKNERAEQCIRTALALLTEGVVAAPIDGVASAKIEENPDGSKYLSVSFAGPIRSAGGTAQALAVLIAHYTSNLLGLSEYRPTESELERYAEEVNLYHNAVSRLQYKASDDEVKLIVKNCPVCISGEPTSEVEVDVYKDLERIATNRVRGGMCLVISEGIAQKASKVVKYSQKFGLDWDWLKAVIKGGDTEDGVRELKPIDTYIKDVVAGRPIFAYPSRQGGFRLRYGRARNTGLMTKGLHPATMSVLGGFPAIGTQLKLERPGKGMTVVPVDIIEPPVVRLTTGEVLRVDSPEQADDLEKDIEEILFNGDLLVSFGDFQKSNHPIVPSPWVEEWWALELKEKGVEAKAETFDEALEISKKHGVPLHPKYTFNYHDTSVEELKSLAKWLDSGMEKGPEKRTLETLLVPHKLKGDYVYIEPETKKALMTTLGNGEGDAEDVMEFVNKLSPVKIMKKAPLYVGARMGRPEKARERLMTPAPHVLFPVGNYGGATRSVMKAYNDGTISVNITRYRCPKCGKLTLGRMCECGGRAELDFVCPRCGRKGKKCLACGTDGTAHDARAINIKEAMDRAIKKVGKPNPKLKGVKGLMSKHRVAEPLEKGILRSRHEVYLFKDGTIRFDSTNLPLTHFTPKEIGTSVEKLKEMGYTADAKGEELLRDDQVVELFPQDVVLAERGGDYLFRVSRFIDELLQGLYGQEAYYNCRTPKDLVGQLLVGLAPHTSAGVLGRIIGFSKAHGCYAHPYFHAACRRDCDGDEDAVMLLADALINFSKLYLPSTRGGSMDAPLVLTLALDPSQVDDQVHEMDVPWEYPLGFYRTSHELRNPSSYRIEMVAERLGKESQYSGFGYTHATNRLDNGVVQSSYTKLGSMVEKVDAQLSLGKKIRSVDEKDEAERLLNSHFFRDIYGNLRAFGQQKFRCVDCNAKYRRVPLVGKCTKCGGKVILTIAEGSVRKYVKISKGIVEKYGLPDYMAQRLKLVEDNINSVFINDKSKQYNLADFF
ncbi:DNA polymerase II large subunit [archaeon]